MHGTNSKDISKFYIAGINYKKTEAAIRGEYAVSNEQYASLLATAPMYGISELFVLSTCNRTEIYGFAEEASQLIHLLCSQTKGTEESFRQRAYIKKGLHAVEHLFHVASGLDSQILGDYEIVGQIRQAVNFSRQHHFTGPYSDRLVDAALQSSKVIKNQTNLSNGTVSVSFAAVQYIRQTITDLSNKNILMLGTGKLGRSTCRNVVDYLGTSNITLINRTIQKAEVLAAELGLQYATLDDLSKCIDKADIIIVATNATIPAVLRSHLENKGQKLIIDLSIPYNVEISSQELPGITMVNVDELSRIKDDTVKKREAEVPKAKAIIREHMEVFLEWSEMRKHVPILKAMKSKLQEITAREILPFFSPSILSPSELCPSASNEKIQKIINIMARKMRRQNTLGCQYIEAINDFMATRQID